jgi:hypothetical protein
MAYDPPGGVHDPLQRVLPSYRVVRIELDGVAPAEGERTASFQQPADVRSVRPGPCAGPRFRRAKPARPPSCRRWSGFHTRTLKEKSVS